MRRVVIKPTLPADIDTGTSLVLGNSAHDGLLMIQMQKFDAHTVLIRITPEQARIFAARLILGADEIEGHLGTEII